MQAFLIIFRQQLILLVYVAIGIFAVRSGRLSAKDIRPLNFLLVKVGLPALIIRNMQTDLVFDNRGAIFYTAVVSFLVYFFLIAIPVPFISSKHPGYLEERLSISYKNGGFVALPLAIALYGDHGALNLSIFNIALTIFLWTHGVLTVSKFVSWKKTLKDILNPGVIGMLAALFFVALRIRLPELVMQPVEGLAALSIPLAMLIVGMSIGSVKEPLKKLDPHAFYVSLVSMVIVPLIVYFLLTAFRVDHKLCVCIMIFAGSPTASMLPGIIIAAGRDETPVTTQFILTTFLSLITLSSLMFLA